MARLEWDKVGQRFYEAGVDRGVLYLGGGGGGRGYAWNGLISVNSMPSGGEATPYYIDGVKYLNEIASDEFAATITAFTYPKQFQRYEGLQTAGDGLYVDNQPRSAFGLSYRTGLGNDILNLSYGYRIHLVYNAKVSASDKTYQTMTDLPEASNFSWPITTTPVVIDGMKATSHLIIDSRETDPLLLASLENRLYGAFSRNPYLPTPEELIILFETYQPTGYGYGPYGNTVYGYGGEY